VSTWPADFDLISFGQILLRKDEMIKRRGEVLELPVPTIPDQPSSKWKTAGNRLACSKFEPGAILNFVRLLFSEFPRDLHYKIPEVPIKRPVEVELSESSF
jgi:hypothetical protein